MKSNGRHAASNTALVFELLRDHGDMTSVDVARRLGISRVAASNACADLSRESKTVPKRIFVTEWVYEQASQKTYPRKLYAVGSYPDAREPMMGPTISRPYTGPRITSVWDLGALA